MLSISMEGGAQLHRHDACVCFPPEHAGLDQVQLWVRDLTMDSPQGYKKFKTFPDHTPISHTPAHPPACVLDHRMSKKLLPYSPKLTTTMQETKY